MFTSPDALPLSRRGLVRAKAWFSLAHKYKHKHMCKQVKTGRHKHNHICVSKWKLSRHKQGISTRKTDKVVLCACAYGYVVALTSENWVDISTSISTRPWTNHFDPDLVRTYEKQYGGHSVRHLVYHWVEWSWYGELSQICHSARAYAYGYTLVKTWLKVTKA